MCSVSSNLGTVWLLSCINCCSWCERMAESNSGWPQHIASETTFHWCRFSARQLAPCSTNNCVHLVWPKVTAKWSGVRPRGSFFSCSCCNQKYNLQIFYMLPIYTLEIKSHYSVSLRPQDSLLSIRPKTITHLIILSTLKLAMTLLSVKTAVIVVNLLRISFT